MAEYRYRETAAITAADTAYVLQARGTATAADFTVPPNASRITAILATLASDGAATGAGVFWMELTGEGLSQQQIALGGVGGTLATSGIQTVGTTYIPVNIPVKANSAIQASVLCNVDTGTASVGVTFEFQ